MPTTRRQFLEATLGSSALVSMGLTVPAVLAKSARALADSSAGAEGNVLVVVQLSGGNDGLNTVVPFADDAYLKNREALRVGTDQVLKINDRLGFHPQMQGFADLLSESRLCILQGIGYANPDRSHFRSMDIWHTAKPDVVDNADGWLGRCLDCEARQAKPGANRPDVPALHLGPNQLPLALISRESAVPSIESLDGFKLAEGQAVPLGTLQQLAAAQRPARPLGEQTLLEFLQRTAVNAYKSSEKVQQVLAQGKDAAAYPEFGLARKLANVAKLIDAGLSTRIYYVSLDGFDTHANQAAAHAALLTELTGSCRAFVNDLAARGHADRVAVLVFSEFGRRVKENASEGTDHGAAAPAFVLGGKVQSGTIGDHPSLTDLDNEGDLKFHTDFRRLYATLLDSWLACPSTQVLPGTFEHLPIFKA